jgi:hypothetical protein
MAEQEWLGCNDPQPLLESLRGKVYDRKLRLFACACCRRIWHLLHDERSRKAVEVAERFADGLTAEAALYLAESEALKVRTRAGVFAARVAVEDISGETHWVYETKLASPRSCEPVLYEAEAALLKDIIGNPFRPPSLQRSCITPTVTNLATAAYDKRILPAGTLDPARLAILADALDEAGCDNAGLLSHLRGEGPHVRGCWPLDQILGKA